MFVYAAYEFISVIRSMDYVLGHTTAAKCGQRQQRLNFGMQLNAVEN